MNADNLEISDSERKCVRLHLTNIVGLGAVRLLQSLLPAIVDLSEFRVEKAYLPAIGELANYAQFEHGTGISRYKRYLPNAISRLLECTLFGNQFAGQTPLLVFGDIPIRCRTKQTVFVQTSLLTQGSDSGRSLGALKYRIARWLFRRNMRYAAKYIVQTEAMKAALIASYPEIKNRIHVVAQPAPSWLIDSRLKRTKFQNSASSGLSLFYPAAAYPHKNHRILSEIDTPANWPIQELKLTISGNLNPNPSLPWIRCVNQLGPDEVLDAYQTADALLFLSLSESFGLPLVEAMWIGLPIVCPDLPYARALCGSQAIYFNPYDLASLQAAISELVRRRDSGWWPDWSAELEKIPRDWAEVAGLMLQLTTAEQVPN